VDPPPANWIPPDAVCRPEVDNVLERVIAAAPIVPVKVGDALITTFPDPVRALETSCLDPLVNMAWEAVALLNTGAAVKVATPVTARVEEKEPVVADIPARVVAPVTPRVEDKVIAAAPIVPVKVGPAVSATTVPEPEVV